ncbi:hypothetical protein IMSHALPRED_004850 [Imshaugia aleurites]|uniref:Uncharacterized protein n=1 Tax=Imshaugia aleurites TaxID=172621 RepID=A0A8H3J984_9LECA|nr:hypothetical protein IMSHALPRED_004850 [Imshaugia aleurites]
MRLTNKQFNHDHFDNYETNQSHFNKFNKKRGYHDTNTYSEEILERLRKKGKCYRCQKSGYMIMNDDALCKPKSKKFAELEAEEK